jgi:antitoxin CcdA
MRMSTARTTAQPTGRRQAVYVSLDPTLVAEARELGIPLSATLEQALRVRIADARALRWREENRDAIEDFNARVARSGVFSDGLRRF